MFVWWCIFWSLPCCLVMYILESTMLFGDTYFGAYHVVWLAVHSPTHPFLSIAFQNICSEGYTHFWSEPALGIPDSSLLTDKEKGCPADGCWLGGGIWRGGTLRNQLKNPWVISHHVLVVFWQQMITKDSRRNKSFPLRFLLFHWINLKSQTYASLLKPSLLIWHDINS